MFEQALKETFTLKFAIAGIAGVGKSYTSFQLARELAEGSRFAVIDSENRKARKYADEFQFDVSDLTDDFSLAAYTKEIKLAESLGYKVLVIDGLSQMWEGKKGIKEQVEMIAKRDRISTFSAWQTGNNLLADFMTMILNSPMHIICTLRSKPDYSSKENESGKTQYKRIGLAPIQKDNMEFEFDLFAEMDTDHRLIFQKSLCKPLSGKVLPMANEGETKRLASILKKWMVGDAPRPQIEDKSEKNTTAPVQREGSEGGPDPRRTAATRQQMQELSQLYQAAGKQLPGREWTYAAADAMLTRLRGSGQTNQLAVVAGAPPTQELPEEIAVELKADAEASVAADLLTDGQWNTLVKLYLHLGRSMPEENERLDRSAAKALIAQLSQEYRQHRQKAG